MKILAVDDDQVALDLLEAALVNADYTDIHTADSAERALDKLVFDLVPFDCILLDVNMPGMDGIDLCRMIRLKEDYSSIPIIMITAVTDQRTISRAIDAGATDYVTKPFNGLELGARLRAAGSLSAALRKHNEYKTVTRGLEERLAKIETFGLEDTIELDCVQGLVTDLQMENQLLRLPKGVFGLEVVAVSIVNILEIFNDISQHEFRQFLNLIASRIINTLDGSQFSISYRGNGIFTIVIKKTKVTKDSNSESRIKAAVLNEDYAMITDLGFELQVECAKPRHPDLWSGREAVDGINEAIKRVRLKSLDRLSETKLKHFRASLLKEDEKREKHYWLVNSLLGATDAPARMLPRRIRAKGRKSRRQGTHSKGDQKLAD